MEGMSQRVSWRMRGKARAEPASAYVVPTGPGDFTPTVWTRLLILQPTPFCNIDCDYCYLPDRKSTARMSAVTVRLAARRLLEDGLLGRELTVVWHAGEPMVLSPAWYEEAIEIIREELGQQTRITHSIQTNGTLISDAWCKLITRADLRIGVSVDGPADLHDRHRRTRGGKGTHAKVMEGTNRLRDAGIPFHAIAVVTRETFDAVDRFVEFFDELGISELGCNFDEIEGEHRSSSLASGEELHRRFLGQLLAWSRHRSVALRVRELILAQRLILQGLPSVRWQGRAWPENCQLLPWALISVAHDGRFSTFSPELLGQHNRDYADFVFGNVTETGYLEAATDPAFQRVWADICRGISACEQACAYFSYCGGGSPINKLYELGDLGGVETLYCRTMMQRPFDVMLQDAETYLVSRNAA